MADSWQIPPWLIKNLLGMLCLQISFLTTRSAARMGCQYAPTEFHTIKEVGGLLGSFR
jgi:hypothetical protein